MNFSETYQAKVKAIEAILIAYLPERTGYQAVIMEAMEYALMGGGKRKGGFGGLGGLLGGKMKMPF